jgi:predicted ester cyclase
VIPRPYEKHTAAIELHGAFEPKLFTQRRAREADTIEPDLTDTSFATMLLSLVLAQQKGPGRDGGASEAAVRETEKRNEEVIRQGLAALNRGDLDTYVQHIANTMTNFGVLRGPEGIRRGVEDILRTFPDWHMEVQDLIARGDTVVVRMKVSGTHRGVGKLPMNGGMLVGVEPTQKHFSVEHIHWYKLLDGKVVDHTATRNDIGMMRQLGLLPPTGLPK